nr:unnamed protein product [Callosobruchus chinensis]CAH7753239.1 unnamed protein product [Callosobruchus chinensis]
MLRNSESK